jgi:nitroreductase
MSVKGVRMDLQSAINLRHSRRSYDGKGLPLDTAVKLHDMAAEYSRIPGVDIRLVTNNGLAFNGFTKSYGIFSGVNDYFLLIRNKDNPKSAIKLGYYGEMIVLRCTQLGLDTCWVGGAFSRRDLNIVLDDGQVVEAAITVGHSPRRHSFQENLLRIVFHPRTKRVADMYTSEANFTPNWFVLGMAAVQKAPSTYNRQPAHFIYRNDGTVSAEVKDIETAPYMGLDLGIAKLHFEIGSGKKFGTDSSGAEVIKS